MTSPLPATQPHLAFTAARKDFEVFLRLGFHALNPTASLSDGWYLSALAHELAGVASGETKRLLITLPPRHLKSITASVLFPAWVLGHNPAFRIICATYGQDLSAHHARDFRKVMTSGWYRQVFPGTARSIARDTDTELITLQKGYRFSTALGGTITGRGADLIIIDDPMKTQEVHSLEAREKAFRFVDETLLSRLDNKGTGQIIAIQQRQHEMDVAAHLIAKGNFRHLNLPAIAVEDEQIALTSGRLHHRRIGEVLDPHREPRSTLDALREEMGNRAFEAQYQQNPVPSNSEYADWTQIQFYDEAPERHDITHVVHSWDTASRTHDRANFSVCTVWGHDGQCWLLLDLIRVRKSYSDLLARVRAERNHWRPDAILVEDASTGDFLLGELDRDRRGVSARQHHSPTCTPIRITPIASKEERFFSSVERLYTGFAKLPREAPWLADLRREIHAFPDGAHDDQVDSMSQFLNWAVQNRGRGLLTQTNRQKRLEQRYLAGMRRQRRQMPA